MAKGRLNEQSLYSWEKGFANQIVIWEKGFANQIVIWEKGFANQIVIWEKGSANQIVIWEKAPPTKSSFPRKRESRVPVETVRVRPTACLN